MPKTPSTKLKDLISQWIQPLNKNNINFTTDGTTLFCQLIDYLNRIQDYITEMENIEVNEVEYAYLKLISLFNTDNPSERQQLYKLQEKAVKELKQHLIKECNDEHRVAILLLRLPTLRSLQPNIIEEIFFSSLLGSFQIDAVIPQILKLKCSSTEYEDFVSKNFAS